MPPPPEFRYGFGKIRAVKILHQTKSHDLRSPYRNQGISRKITVYLYGKQDARQQIICPLIITRAAIDRIHQDPNAVGNDNLLEISPEHDQKPPPEILIGKNMLFANLL